MAETPVPAGLSVQQWDDNYFREYLNKSWFKKFMGTGTSAMIQVNEDLTKKPGDAVTFSLVNKLKGRAKDSNERLEGQEEKLDLRSQKITVREYAHAVEWGDFEDQRTAIDLRQAHKDTLMDWNMELDRDNVIDALGSIDGISYLSATTGQRDTWTANNSDRVQFGKLRSNTSTTHALSLANVDATDDRLTSTAISVMKRMAKNCAPKVRPMQPRKAIEESDSFIFLAQSNCIKDLTTDAVFQQANREARERGSSNPLFNSADYVWDNIYIYEIEDLPIYTGVGAGGTVNVSPCYLLGAQALGMAWAKRPQTVNKEFDYGRFNGIAIKQWYKVEKLRFGTAPGQDTTTLKDNGIVTGFFANVADV